MPVTHIQPIIIRTKKNNIYQPGRLTPMGAAQVYLKISRFFLAVSVKDVNFEIVA
jgi:hypothetical protein